MNSIYNKTIYSYLKPKNSSRIGYIKSSKDFWENRYAKGGNSGPGSYNHLAKFKASVLNNFVKLYNIGSVIEWGSGDCNQLSLANYKTYIGYDVSKTAINICKKKFYNDSTKTFIYLENNYMNDKKADLSISLDVIFHLLEDDVYEKYMNNLFNSSNKFIIIYSSNIEGKKRKAVRQRRFTDWIDRYMSKNWKLKDFIPNKYPWNSNFKRSTSFCDFYIYEKIK